MNHSDFNQAWLKSFMLTSIISSFNRSDAIATGVNLRAEQPVMPSFEEPDTIATDEIQELERPVKDVNDDVVSLPISQLDGPDVDANDVALKTTQHFIASTRLSQPGPAAASPLQWFQEWPQIVQYCSLVLEGPGLCLMFLDMYNRPDPSGAHIHKAQFDDFLTQYTRSWVKPEVQSRLNLDITAFRDRQTQLFCRAPLLFTAEIYQAESARLQDRLPRHKLMWLRKQLIASVNQRLSNRKTACDLECVGVVSHLILEAFKIGDRANIYKLAKGLLSILQMMEEAATFYQNPGLKALVALALLVSGLIPRSGPNGGVRTTAASRSRISFDHLRSGDQNRFTNSAAGSPLRQSMFHRLRLALQPVSSGLNAFQMRNFLVNSFMGPLQNFLFALAALFDTAEDLCDNCITKEQARLKVNAILEYLNQTQTYSSGDQLSTMVFSRHDVIKYHWIMTCVSLCSRILALHMLYLMSPSSVTFKDFDGLVSSFLELVICSTTSLIPSEVIIWAFFMVLPLHVHHIHRRQVLPTLQHHCHDLCLNSWQDVKALLSEIFFCSRLQEEDCYTLWLELQKLTA